MANGTGAPPHIRVRRLLRSVLAQSSVLAIASYMDGTANMNVTRCRSITASARSGVNADSNTTCPPLSSVGRQVMFRPAV